MTSKIAEAMRERMDNIQNMEEFDDALREVAQANLPKGVKQETWAEEHRQKIEAALERRRKAKEKSVSNPGDASASTLRSAERSLKRTTRHALQTHLSKICNKMQ